MLTRLAALAGIVFFLAACSTTRITFDGPPGTVLFVDKKPHNLPAEIELYRPAETGASNRYPASLIYRLPDMPEVKADGYVDVFGYTESDVDAATTNRCELREQQLHDLANGTKLVYQVKTASRQPLLELTLKKQ